MKGSAARRTAARSTARHCICPGGMMNGVVEDVMLKTGIYWPKAHCDAQMMADLSRAL